MMDKAGENIRNARTGYFRHCCIYLLLYLYFNTSPHELKTLSPSSNIPVFLRLFVNHLKATPKEGSKSWMKKQYPVIEQSDGHSCGIFVLMAADAILAEKSPGIMRNCHVEKYSLCVLQRILQYAKDKGDMQGGGNPMMAVDGQGNVTNEIQTVTLETRDVLEKSCTMTTEQGGPTIHEEDGHETHEGTDCAIASDKNTEDYPCLDQHLLHKQTMACLLVVALAENNLEERMLWAGSDTGTRVERETYKQYIVWALKVFDINEEEYTENMMKHILSQLAGCCLHHEAGSYRIRNHEVAIKLREILLSDVRQLVERMDLEFIFRYVTFSGDPTEEEQLDVPFKIDLKHDDLHIVAKRFATAVHDREFAFVCMHSLFQVETFVNMVWENLLHYLNKDRFELLKVLSKDDIIYGYSFLFWASITDNSHLLKKALNSVQFKVKNRQEALFGSCFGSSVANFEYLCSKNNWKLDTLCMTLPELPRPLIIKLQLAVVDDLRVKFGKCSLLDIACMGGLSAVASRLSHLMKTSKNKNSSRKNTYVHYAAMCKKGKDIIDIVIKKGQRSINIIGPEGSTPLHYSCAVGNVSIVSYLLQKVVDIGKPNKKGETGLHLACTYGNAEVVKMLLQNKGISHVTDNYGNTPLHRAAWQGHMEIVEVLLQNKANVDDKHDDGSTPLHDAAWQGHREVLEVLLLNKANVDEKDEDGRTPLHDAAWQGHREVVEVLLQNKANVDEKDDKEETALQKAEAQHHDDIARIITEATNIHDLTTNHSTIIDRVTTDSQFLMKSSSIPHGSYNNGGWLTSTPLTSTCPVNHASVELPGVYVPSQLGQAVSTDRQSVMEEIALQSSQPYHIDGNLNNLLTDPARMEIHSPNQRSETIYGNSSHLPTYVHAPVVGDTLPSSDTTSNSENVIIHYTESGEKIELQQL